MRTVFFDIDTQIDFLFPSGALYVPGAERIIPEVARLNRYAAERGIPLVSTVDAHTEDDAEFRLWPHHCVAGALGQRKPEATLAEGRRTLPNRACDLSAIQGARQIVLEKQTVDAFQSVNLSAILGHLAADRFVVYGVVTEICVLHAARGLLRLGKPVAIVTDAIAALREDAATQALAEVCSGGATLATVAEICG